eukprot:TRINITY_DN156_c0_g1_i2.p1 TRINITY_DN156_c0_g1~~TRINITY_DN156_c0_g1_i2.p1  ORF type:complete len:278 (-),score=68.33 TRINITY_DN156_c0_g1_i2:91-924(-)
MCIRDRRRVHGDNKYQNLISNNLEMNLGRASVHVETMPNEYLPDGRRVIEKRIIEGESRVSVVQQPIIERVSVIQQPVVVQQPVQQYIEIPRQSTVITAPTQYIRAEPVYGGQVHTGESYVVQAPTQYLGVQYGGQTQVSNVQALPAYASTYAPAYASTYTPAYASTYTPTYTAPITTSVIPTQNYATTYAAPTYATQSYAAPTYAAQTYSTPTYATQPFAAQTYAAPTLARTSVVPAYASSYVPQYTQPVATYGTLGNLGNSYTSSYLPNNGLYRY